MTHQSKQLPPFASSLHRKMAPRHKFSPDRYVLILVSVSVVLFTLLRLTAWCTDWRMSCADEAVYIRKIIIFLSKLHWEKNCHLLILVFCPENDYIETLGETLTSNMESLLRRCYKIS